MDGTGPADGARHAEPPSCALLTARPRPAQVALPGAPFFLLVKPGSAYAPATKLPHQASFIRSTVGKDWHELTLTAADKMGNACVRGGAPVRLSSSAGGERVLSTECVDKKDGTYALQWRSEASGSYQLQVAPLSLLLPPLRAPRCVVYTCNMYHLRR